MISDGELGDADAEAALLGWRKYNGVEVVRRQRDFDERYSGFS